MKRLFLTCVFLVFSTGLAPLVAIGGGLPVPVNQINPTIGITSPGNMTIKPGASQSIYNWQSFNIGYGSSVTFQLPLANAAVLNRVQAGGGPSSINGLLSSLFNGQPAGNIYLLNPNGILIGPSGVINVGSFIGSTLDFSADPAQANAKFLAGGNLIFSGSSSAGIVNQGQINALGDVFLIAHTVDNSGGISAKTVGLAAGSEVELKQVGQPDDISVIAGLNGSPAAVGVNNSGTIQAVSADLQAAGGNIYALAINNAGAVRTGSIVNRNGTIILKAAGGNIHNSGTLSAQNGGGGGGSITVDGGHNAASPSTVINSGVVDASGTTGGSVQITGDQVTLAAGSSVNVSGQFGGGVALIGGGAQGGDPSVLNAQQTTVAAGATINASAGSLGNGGNVVIWSDNTTIFGGQISARGGANGGNGGSAEVSSAQNLLITGHADLTAPNGNAGTLLLDPGSVDIVQGPDAAPPGSMDSFYDGWINNQLTLGSLTIDTYNANNANSEDLTVAVSANINWANANALTLNGNNSITVNGIINNSGAGQLNLTSGGAITINNDLTAGSITIHSGSTGLGNLIFGTVPGTGGPVTVQADTQSYQSGIGNGSASIAQADLVDNAPIFLNFAGTASPVSFTFRQDATIADANIPAAGQFFNFTPPASYTIQSDGGNITLATAANVAGSALTLSAHGILTIGVSLTGSDSLSSLSASGSTIVLNGGGVTTSAGQTYDGAVMLGTADTLTGTTLGLAGVMGGNSSLTLVNSGLGTLGGAVSGVSQLNATGAGTLAVSSPISGNLVNDQEATMLGGGTVTTTAGNGQNGSQTYTKAVTLGADDTLSGSTVGLNSTVDGAHNLTVNGTAILGGAVGGVTELASLTLNNGAALNGGPVKTTGAQTYNGPVILGVDDTLSGSTVTFGSTVDGAHALTVNGTANSAGPVAFNGVVGGTTELTGLTITAGTVVAGVDTSENASFTLSVPVYVSGNMSVTAGGDFEITPAVHANDKISIHANNGSDNTSINVSGNLSVTAGGDVAINAPVNVTDDMSITAGGNVNFNALITGPATGPVYDPENVTDTLSVTSGGSISQTSVGIITFANLHLSASDPITLVDAGNQFANVQAEYNNDNLYFGSVVNSSDQVYGQNDLYAGNADVALPELGGKLLGQVAAAINPEPKRQETIQTEPGSFSTAPPPGYILRSSQMSGE